MLNRFKSISPQRQRGLSIVELMVGVAIGLFVAAGATTLLVAQLTDNRRLLLETQVQQDLRATADIITRELRRAGHWARARDAAWYPDTPGVASNPYTAVSATAGGTDYANGDQDSTVLIAYARSGNEALEDGAVVAAEHQGFRLYNGVIQTQLGEDNWQALTDGTTLRVTRFELTMNKQPITLACPKDCPVGAPSCPPTQEVRVMTIDIAGQAVSDPAVQRSVRSAVRLRNDNIVGTCPA